MTRKSINPYINKKTLESLGPSGTQFLNIGGFFTVRAVSHFFEQGKFETVIDTIFSKSANAQYNVFEEARIVGQKDREEARRDEKINKKAKEAKEKSCKSLMEEVEGVKTQVYRALDQASKNSLSEMSEFAVALFKAISDNSDSEISDNDLESVVGGAGTPAGNSPNMVVKMLLITDQQYRIIYEQIFY